MSIEIRIILYVLLGMLPSLVWLLYYLGKDLHPEPKKMILKVFIYGAIATAPVFLVQVWLYGLLNSLQPFAVFQSFPVLADIIKWFLIIALSEELFKYLLVRVFVLKSYEVDEPLDVMLYMIVVALGFAAVENILYLFSPLANPPFGSVIEVAIIVSFIRFIGATFLHTLCSGLLGYFMALSFFETKKRLFLTFVGISLAVLLHGFYDFSIMAVGAYFEFVLPVVIIAGSAAFLLWAFRDIKKLKDVCEV